MSLNVHSSSKRLSLLRTILVSAHVIVVTPSFGQTINEAPPGDTAVTAIVASAGMSTGRSRDDLISPMAATTLGPTFSVGYERTTQSTRFDVAASFASTSLSYQQQAFSGFGLFGSLQSTVVWHIEQAGLPLRLAIGPTFQVFIDYEDATTRTYNPSWTLAAWLGPSLQATFTASTITGTGVIELPLLAYVVRPRYTVFDDAMLDDIASVFWSGTWTTVAGFPIVNLSASVRPRSGHLRNASFAYALRIYAFDEPRAIRRYDHRIIVQYHFNL